MPPNLSSQLESVTRRLLKLCNDPLVYHAVILIYT